MVKVEELRAAFRDLDGHAQVEFLKALARDGNSIDVSQPVTVLLCGLRAVTDPTYDGDVCQMCGQ